ncbi:MAG: helix-turn-helix domain-containing protein [Jatrophihabitantaceae bacterium]
MSTAQNPTPITAGPMAGDQVKQALIAHPGSSTIELAEATGLGKSTVGKALAALEAAGLARRDIPAVNAGGRRPAAQWNAITTDPDSHGSEPRGNQRGSGADPAADSTRSSTNPAAGDRLRPGQLGTLVLEYLVAHAQEPVGPTTVSKALNRSSGAVANVLARLAASEDIVLVTETPRRYRLTS